MGMTLGVSGSGLGAHLAPSATLLGVWSPASFPAWFLGASGRFDFIRRDYPAGQVSVTRTQVNLWLGRQFVAHVSRPCVRLWAGGQAGAVFVAKP